MEIGAQPALTGPEVSPVPSLSLGGLSQPKQTWCAFNDVWFLWGSFGVGLFLLGVPQSEITSRMWYMDKEALQRFLNPRISWVLTCSSLWCLPFGFLGAHSHFPCRSSVQHMSSFLSAAGGTMWFKSSSAISFQGKTQPAPSCPPPQALLRSEQGMGCTQHELWHKQPIPSPIFPRESVPEAAWKGRREVGWSHLALEELPGVSRTIQEFTSSSRKWPGSSCAPAKFMGYSHVQVFFGVFFGFWKEGSACRTVRCWCQMYLDVVCFVLKQ